jgi:hypothetical protein
MGIRRKLLALGTFPKTTIKIEKGIKETTRLKTAAIREDSGKRIGGTGIDFKIPAASTTEPMI